MKTDYEVFVFFAVILFEVKIKKILFCAEVYFT